jgi:hypothetical protein
LKLTGGARLFELIGRQVKAPGRTSIFKANSFLIIHESYRSKRQCCGGKFLAGFFVERSGQFLMVKSRLFGSLFGINQDKLMTALDRFAIPEARCFLNPDRTVWNVNRLPLKFFSEGKSPIVVLNLSLRPEWRRDKRENRRKNKESQKQSQWPGHFASGSF